MLHFRRWSLLLLLPLLFSGCATTITNLTPEHQPRDPQGLYPVEFAFNSQQQSLKWETIKAVAIIGEQHYPMTKVEVMRNDNSELGSMRNRYEGFIPVPANTNLIHYRFKVYFEYQDFGKRPADSALSTTYGLHIQEAAGK